MTQPVSHVLQIQIAILASIPIIWMARVVNPVRILAKNAQVLQIVKHVLIITIFLDHRV